MHTVKILGMGDPFYHTLKQRLETAIEQLGVRAIVEEVTDVDTILNYKISSIPSILIREQEMRLNGALPEIDEIKYYLEKHLKERKRMKKILVPVDFSEVSGNALRFAMEIAKQNGATLDVVHVMAPNGNLDSYLTPELEEVYEGDKTEILKTFIKQAGNCNGNCGLTINAQIIEGYPAEKLIELSKDTHLNLMVMGTTGRNNMLEHLFGRISTDVAKNAWCPVLLIPGGSEFKGFSSILCASNHFAVDEVMMRKMINFSNLFDAKVSMLKVNERKGSRYRVINREYEEVFMVGEEAFSCQLAVVDCNDVIKGINRYASETKPDLLVFFTIHRSLIENVFHKSVTNKMIMKMDSPILVMHYDD